MRFKCFLFFLIIHYFSLFSYEFSPNNNTVHNAHAEMHGNYQVDTQSSSNWHFSGRVIAKHDYSSKRSTHYSAIAKECWVELISCMGKGEQSAEIALTAENIPVKCTEEIASLMNSTEKVGGGAKATQVKCPEDIIKKIRNVGDDILDVMEKAGGHTLERHVAKTSTDLAKRIAKNSFVKNASSFTNKRMATKAVKESLKQNAEKISLWLNDKLKDQLVLEFSHSYSIGSVASKIKGSSLCNLMNSRIVLEKDLIHELGFKILTAFPIVK
jgi:hypothetical protein